MGYRKTGHINVEFWGGHAGAVGGSRRQQLSAIALRCLALSGLLVSTCGPKIGQLLLSGRLLVAYVAGVPNGAAP